jgi:hypothetical protein
VTVDRGDERPLLEIIVTVPWRRMGSTRSIISAWLFRRKTEVCGVVRGLRWFLCFIPREL